MFMGGEGGGGSRGGPSAAGSKNPGSAEAPRILVGRQVSGQMT